MSKFGVNKNPSGVYAKIKKFKSEGKLPLEAGVSVESGTILKGISRYHILEDGGVWVKSDVPKSTQLLQFEEAVNNIADTITPIQPIQPPLADSTSADTLTVYTIGDAHIGMLAHKAETGADNDLKIIEANIITAMDLLLNSTHPSDECLIVDVGDFQHADNENNTTARSGNHLDVDGRYHKVLDISLNLATKLIDKALLVHKTVRWRSAIGNHNGHVAIMLTAFVKAYYRNEPRVIVHDTPNPFMYHQFGKNLIGITHGDTTKPADLGSIMSVDCEDLWSSTKFRYFYTGHIHHLSTKEYTNCVVETFRTMASKDAWHNAHGYRSGQDMKAIILHKDYGEISRNTVSLAAVIDNQLTKDTND